MNLNAALQIIFTSQHHQYQGLKTRSPLVKTLLNFYLNSICFYNAIGNSKLFIIFLSNPGYSVSTRFAPKKKMSKLQNVTITNTPNNKYKDLLFLNFPNPDAYHCVGLTDTKHHKSTPWENWLVVDIWQWHFLWTSTIFLYIQYLQNIIWKYH